MNALEAYIAAEEEKDGEITVEVRASAHAPTPKLKLRKDRPPTPDRLPIPDRLPTPDRLSSSESKAQSTELKEVNRCDFDLGSVENGQFIRNLLQLRDYSRSILPPTVVASRPATVPTTVDIAPSFTLHAQRDFRSNFAGDERQFFAKDEPRDVPATAAARNEKETRTQRPFAPALALDDEVTVQKLLNRVDSTLRHSLVQLEVRP
ncbi:MAG: hypothetical protein MHM6MM_005984 [Cercozoa sp. M6MM]